MGLTPSRALPYSFVLPSYLLVLLLKPRVFGVSNVPPHLLARVFVSRFLAPPCHLALVHGIVC